MKKHILHLALSLSLITCSLTVFTFSGCSTHQQTVTYKTLYSLEKTTVAAYDGYLNLVIKGQLPTNDVPRVSEAFNKYQSAFVVALDVAQFNTNALAPDSLLVLSQDLINLINEVKPSTK